MTKAKEIAEALRQANYGVTELKGSGRSGEVTVVATVVPRRDSKKIVRLASELDSKSFITIDDMREVKHGYIRLVK
jgi:uncharacterized protein YebE (UPF0316 family)